jgi:hypothetical protein
VQNFQKFIVAEGRKGFSPERLGEAVHLALSTAKPKARYAVALGIWIQEFHCRYFGRNAEGRQYSRNWWAAIETDPGQAPISPGV